MNDSTIFRFLENEQMVVDYNVDVGLIKPFGFRCCQQVSMVYRNTTKTNSFYFRCTKNAVEKRFL
jgi:hypothetical protein